MITEVRTKVAPRVEGQGYEWRRYLEGFQMAGHILILDQVVVTVGSCYYYL